MLEIALIIGSTRPKRFADRVTEWVQVASKDRSDFRVSTLDLRDFPLPFLEEPVPPSAAGGRYSNPAAEAWRQGLAPFDAFIVVAAEYNHGPTAVLKNALDSACIEWNRKPIAFVGYGGVGAARAIEQLRGIAIELQMAPIRAEVNIVREAYLAALTQNQALSSHEYLNKSLAMLFDQLAWWGTALKNARIANT
jgi:NAD(P)H-dependent FMN reductase